jgi:hypothetical protein
MMVLAKIMQFCRLSKITILEDGLGQITGNEMLRSDATVIATALMLAFLESALNSAKNGNIFVRTLL